MQIVDSSLLGYNPDWTRVSTSSGYPTVYCPDHPRAWPTGHVHIHRIIAELTVGRLLKDGEVVHHINEDKDDFSPENLQILANNSEHQKLHARPATVIYANCLECRVSFTRRSGRSARTCSRRCNGIRNRRNQMAADVAMGKSYDIRHGSKVAYGYHKCRCAECREGNKLRMREYLVTK